MFINKVHFHFIAYVEMSGIGSFDWVPHELMTTFHLQRWSAFLGKTDQELDEPFGKDQIFVWQRSKGSGEHWEQVDEIVSVTHSK